MHYEHFLFTRNRRLDFTTFVRPARLTNKEISTIGGIFNYVSDISRLTSDFPSLYTFPLGEYLLLLRQYNSGRQHAGRAIAVIEGIAVAQDDASGFASALPTFVADQADLLNVSASITDIEAASSQPSPDLEWRGSSLNRPTEDFVAEFLTRRDQRSAVSALHPARARSAGQSAGGSAFYRCAIFRFRHQCRRAGAVGAARPDRRGELLHDRASRLSQPRD